MAGGGNLSDVFKAKLKRWLLRQHGGALTPAVRGLKPTTSRLCINCHSTASWRLHGFHKRSDRPLDGATFCHDCMVELEVLFPAYPKQLRNKGLQWNWSHYPAINKWLKDTGRKVLDWKPAPGRDSDRVA